MTLFWIIVLYFFLMGLLEIGYVCGLSFHPDVKHPNRWRFIFGLMLHILFTGIIIFTFAMVPELHVKLL